MQVWWQRSHDLYRSQKLWVVFCNVAKLATAGQLEGRIVQPFPSCRQVALDCRVLQRCFYPPLDSRILGPQLGQQLTKLSVAWVLGQTFLDSFDGFPVAGVRTRNLGRQQRASLLGSGFALFLKLEKVLAKCLQRCAETTQCPG